VGVGVACCVESTGFGRGEPAKIRLSKDGIAMFTWARPLRGRATRTMVALVVAEKLGWLSTRFESRPVTTRHVRSRLLTAGSRSAVMVGSAAAMAGAAMRKQVLERAGDALEADVQDMVLEDGVIGVRGAPVRQMPATDVLPDQGLEVFESFDPKRPLAFSSGCHAAVVAVDPETGQVEVLRYVIAHDTGKPINPVTLEGQLHGGMRMGSLCAVRGGCL